jgi:hypothetical protein
MASIKDVADGFETAVAATSFFQVFVADDLDSINEDSKNSYPYVLFVPVSEVDNTPRKGNKMNVYNVELYATNTQHQGDGEERATRLSKWDAMKDALETLYDSLPATIKKGTTPVTYTYGHAQHNDDLVVVKAELSFIVFDCD